jgi:hypothetical protein
MSRINLKDYCDKFKDLQSGRTKLEINIGLQKILYINP